MCGIAGIMLRGTEAPDAAALDTLRTALRHRGPDGDGMHVAGNLGVVQTRLAIIDLETGDQPLYGPDGLTLVANGEIYNYRELRRELADKRFSTNSDCEPILHLYHRDGLDFTAALRGMYALALYDPQNGSLILSRDPFGIKPLYYVETPSFFAFASEPQALRAAGLADARIVPQHRDELLQLQFTCGRQTIFADIHRLRPGETVVVRNGRIVERRHLPALPEGERQRYDEESALDSLDRVLEESVDFHQRSDVPYGLFLSGGVDSSAILAVMARLNSRPVRAYTVGFSGTDATDERAHAHAVAKAVGADHVEIDFTEDDFWSLLPQIAARMDDPAADYAILPSWKLAERASEECKVVLSGEGGDELFAGYGRYRSVLRPWWLGGRAMRARGTFDGLGVLRTDAAGWRDRITAAEATVTRPERSRLQIAQATDCADWLPHDLLLKLDRCLMAHGVEGRTPFLDRRVADLAFRLPDAMKIRNGHGKWLLRQWLDRTLPVARPFERKRGFTVPVGEWIRREGERLGPLVAASPAIDEIADPDAVRRLFLSTRRRTGLAAWTLLFYALWHRRHVEGVTELGGVFDVLGDT
jgi:asparagine synthase (glutamine-hydrolysing)